MLEVTAVPAFQDNYIWLIHGMTDRGRVAVVDPGDAAPVLSALHAGGFELAAVLVTHHHPDHVGLAGRNPRRAGAAAARQHAGKEATAMNSTILRTATRFLLPLLLLFALVIFLQGHNKPGGGFIGGLTASCAFALWAVAEGVAAARERLRVDPRTLIAFGLGLALATSAARAIGARLDPEDAYSFARGEAVTSSTGSTSTTTGMKAWSRPHSSAHWPR